jgi:hypothetical protein
MPGQRTEMDQFTIINPQTRAEAIAQFPRSRDDQIENRLGIARRAGHHLEHVDCRGLLLDPLAELAVALRQRRGAFLQRAVCLGTADRDHRLLGKGFQQFDLCVGKTAFSYASNRDRADRAAVTHQWY